MGQGCVRPVTAKVVAVVEFPTPITKRQLRRFLGMAGYYRGFCKNFATVVSPLTDLLSSVKKFVWSPQCESAFLAAKDLLCITPVLSAPNFLLHLSYKWMQVLWERVQSCYRRTVPELNIQSVTSLRSSPSVNETTVPSRRRPSPWCWRSNILKFMWVVVVCLLLQKSTHVFILKHAEL